MGQRRRQGGQGWSTIGRDLWHCHCGGLLLGRLPRASVGTQPEAPQGNEKRLLHESFRESFKILLFFSVAGPSVR
jgi:hypothetical protein